MTEEPKIRPVNLLLVGLIAILFFMIGLTFGALIWARYLKFAI